MNTVKYSLLFHAVGLSHHLYSAFYTNTQLDFSKITSERVLDIGRYNFRYFTSWNFIMQTNYMALSLLTDFLLLYGTHLSPKLYKRLSEMRGYIFTTFIFPCTMVVFSLFWTLFYINREFVLPEEADDVLPSWINHSIHTNILILLVAELMLNPKMKIPSFRKSLMGITILTFAYSFCYFGTYFQTGRWLYGIYDILSWPERVAFLFMNYLVTLVFYRTGIFVQKATSSLLSIKDGKYEKLLTDGARKML